MSYRRILILGVAAAAVALASQANAGVNLVANGDFSAGNTGFTSDYHYVEQPPTPSNAAGVPPTSVNVQTYGVGANADLYHGGWADLAAPGGSGNYMIVNGATAQPTPSAYATVWQRTVSVAPDTSYDFSAEIASISPKSPATLEFFANGIQVGSIYTAGAVGVWGTFNTLITVGSVSTVLLSVQDTNLTANGNDFGLANIALSAAIPEPSIWAMLGLGFAGLGFAGFHSRRAAISIV